MEVSISMPGDLHNHSTCSDGSVPIHRLPLMAARAGLDTMAISDHDTLLSVNYCYEHPVQDGVRLLPAKKVTVQPAIYGIAQAQLMQCLHNAAFE